MWDWSIHYDHVGHQSQSAVILVGNFLHTNVVVLSWSVISYTIHLQFLSHLPTPPKGSALTVKCTRQSLASRAPLDVSAITRLISCGTTQTGDQGEEPQLWHLTPDVSAGEGFYLVVAGENVDDQRFLPVVDKLDGLVHATHTDDGQQRPKDLLLHYFGVSRHILQHSGG